MRLIPCIPAIIGCIVATAPAALADSPLTSTDFADAYQDVNVVQQAERNGLNERVLKALSDPKVPQDVRAAIVNEIGWSNEPQQNATIYLDYIARRHNTGPSEITLDMLTPQEAMALGYLLAMDNRFYLNQPIGGPGEVQQTDALSIVEAAVAKAPQDFSVALIHSLIQSQHEFDRGPANWCAVYETVQGTVEEFQGARNMRPQAVDIIMDYIGIYEDNCTNPRSL
ncbi:MAG TPA: hypothetical protein V6C95_20175 [Coleofasciculaceae cyanobacterium]